LAQNVFINVRSDSFSAHPVYAHPETLLFSHAGIRSAPE